MLYTGPPAVKKSRQPTCPPPGLESFTHTQTGGGGGGGGGVFPAADLAEVLRLDAGVQQPQRHRPAEQRRPHPAAERRLELRGGADLPAALALRSFGLSFGLSFALRYGRNGQGG